MKRKIACMALLTAMAVSMITGCGTKKTEGNTTSQTTEEASTVTGTLDEMKNFLFDVTDDTGTSYQFTFQDEKPQGLEDVKLGDRVTVTYTGKVTEVDPFQGEVLSVTKAE